VLGRILVVVYEVEGEVRELGGREDGPTAGEGGESFGQRYLWKREVVRRDEGVEGRSGVGEEAGKAEVEEQEQFEIGDEDSEGEDGVTEVEEGEEDGDGDMGVSAFKGVKGNPPKNVQPKEASVNGGSDEIDDPLSRPNEERPRKDEEGIDEQSTMPCLVDRLFSCVIDLLFCAGFTVPEDVRGEDGTGEKINVSGRVPVLRWKLWC
jgi:hypothetical protein